MTDKEKIDRIRSVLTEWQRGCTCAEPGKPEMCSACTRGALDAIANAIGFEIDPTASEHNLRAEEVQ